MIIRLGVSAAQHGEKQRRGGAGGLPDRRTGRSYGTFTDVPDDGQLAGYFLLDRDARRRAMACRGARSQLGYAVQLGTVRFLGTFLDNPEHAPAEVVAYVAEQLGHLASVLAGYGTERTRFDHRDAIKDAYGYRDLKGDAWWKLTRWLWDRCWSGSERPIALFDLATLHLVENKVLLPGATVLERMVTSIREHTHRKTWRTLAAQPTAAHDAGVVADPSGDVGGGSGGRSRSACASRPSPADTGRAGTHGADRHRGPVPARAVRPGRRRCHGRGRSRRR